MIQRRTKNIVIAGAVFAVVLLGITTFSPGGFMSEPVDLPPMRTHCLGRYLIDLPEEFTLTPGSDVALYYGLGKDFERAYVTVPGRGDSVSSLKKTVGKVVWELEADYHFASPSKNMLASVKKFDDNMVLVRAYDSASMLDYLKLRGILLAPPRPKY